MKEACVILAAGQGSRLGGVNKALLPWRGQSFLAQIVATCVSQDISEIVVVIAAPHKDTTLAHARELGVHSVCNQHPEEGMASSVSVGFQYAIENFEAEAAWLWPVDSPGMHTDTMGTVRKKGAGSILVIPCVESRGGHPSRAAREAWPALASCRHLPMGARSVFRGGQFSVARVEVEDSRICHDVDTQRDLERFT